MDGRSDLFTLGWVLLGLLTRQRFDWPRQEEWDTVDGSSPEAWRQGVHALCTRPGVDVEQVAPHVAEPTRALLRRLLRMDPAERPPSGAALQADLRARLAEVAPQYTGRHAADELQAVQAAATHLRLAKAR